MRMMEIGSKMPIWPKNQHRFCWIISKKCWFWLKINDFLTKNMYCCYIGVVPFTKNCIVVTLKLFHSPKILLFLHWSCVIYLNLYCCNIGVVPFTKNCSVFKLELCHSKDIVMFLQWSCANHQKTYCSCNGSRIS